LKKDLVFNKKLGSYKLSTLFFSKTRSLAPNVASMAINLTDTYKCMKHLNAIGLDDASAKKLAEKLNVLLANYSIFYQNTRGYHWNIKGDKFFELHAKFEELYNDLLLKIDEIAERILTLGQTPPHNYTDYKKDFFNRRKCSGK
jgi:Ferritin-like domain